MQLDGIEVFVAVVEAASFAKAAKRLRMPPATVSAKIARLEERLGVTLILRTTRRLRVTPFGERYYRYCARAVGEMREAERELTTRSSEPSGRLRITAPVDMAQSILPPVVERFLATYADVSVDLVVTNRTVDLLSEGIDVAVRAGPLTDSRLIARKFITGRLGLWASKDYISRCGSPKKPEDLARHAYIGFTVPPPHQFQLRFGKRTLAMPTDARIWCDDIETLRRLILRGNGIGVLPDFICGDDALEPVLPNFTTTIGSVSLVYAAQKFVSPIVRAFIDIAAKYNSE